MAVLIQCEDGSILNFRTVLVKRYCGLCGAEYPYQNASDPINCGYHEVKEYVTPCGQVQYDDWSGCNHIDCAIETAPNLNYSGTGEGLCALGFLLVICGFVVWPLLVIGIIVCLFGSGTESQENSDGAQRTIALLQEFKKYKKIDGRRAKQIYEYPR